MPSPSSLLDAGVLPLAGSQFHLEGTKHLLQLLPYLELTSKGERTEELEPHLAQMSLER